MVLCECPKEVVILTSWTSRNPGRRFYTCPGQGSRRRFIGWFGDKQCQRCKDIIPGLLRAKNNLEEKLKESQARASKLKKMLILS
ncbi:hypothetical protein R6Q57_029887 [Mikania cordata]